MNRLIRLLCPLLLLPATAGAAIILPAIIGDHAMLQAGKPIAIWGWAEPGARITVGFAPQGASAAAETFTATTDAAGKWSGRLPALPAGSAGRLLITSDRDDPRTVEDVVVGEVWLGGGQSNMLYDLAATFGGDFTNPAEVAEITRNVGIAQQEAAAAPLPIRYFNVAHVGSTQPADDVDGHWVQADMQNVPTFSAVAWDFAVALQGRLHVPVGLIVSCVGGAHIEVWMPVATIRATPRGAVTLARYDAIRTTMILKVKAQHETELRAWYAAHPTGGDLPVTDQTPTFPLVSTESFRSLPERLYNGMIHGLEPYTLRGILWFQADGDINTPEEYGDLFRALIRRWRADWGDPLPFYFVEMNNYDDKQTKPVEPSNLALIREAQHAGLQEPGVAMVAAIDVGVKNHHFPNKRPVAERLARLALGACYHVPVGEVNGPLFQGWRIEGSQVRLSFADAGGLRVRGGGRLRGFAIRGAGGPWVWADGVIAGSDIVVWSSRVPVPAAVRYAWASNPITSVENAAGLPLYPFRTDTDSKE